MDYAEHQRTYAGFVALTKVTILAVIIILQSLTLFGIASNGFWLGAILLLLMFIAAAVSVASKGSIKALVGVFVLGLIFMALTL